MGNISSISGGPQQVVRLVRQDGKVLEFYDDMPVEELLVVYPEYVVYHQVQENGLVRRKSLSSKDTLVKGQVYLLLHMRAHQQQQHKAKQQPHGQKVPQHGQRIHHGNGVNGTANRAPKIYPVDGSTTGRVRSAHPAQPHKKIGVAVTSVFPGEEIHKIVEAGAVKIVTKNGTARLSGPLLNRLLNEVSSQGSYDKSIPSPMATSLILGLESIPEEPYHKAVAM